MVVGLNCGWGYLKMNSKTDQTNCEVISLFKQPVVNKNALAEESKPEAFLDIIKKNNERLEKMRADRLKSNESVLKSYRIKN